MGRVILVTGGGRSGKSSFCQRLAEEMPGPRLLIATAVPIDDEMSERIERHRRSRESSSWATSEEPVDVAGVVRRSAGFPVILVDCLTVWVNNLMWQREEDALGPERRAPGSERRGLGAGPGAPENGDSLLSEDHVAGLCEELLVACRHHDGAVILVTNEVGLGVIPDNPTARLYRDLLGRCNQVLAAGADSVVFMVSGLPLTLKGSLHLDTN